EPVLYEGVEEPYIDLEEGRLAAVLLDNIIANRYGLPRPAVRAAATVASGTYAIGVRQDEPDLLQALDGALADMSAPGELRAILSRWHLWDEGQIAPGAADPSSAQPLGNAQLTFTHFALFLRATGFTVLISTLAMGLAVSGGLVLSIARRYGGR